MAPLLDRTEGCIFYFIIMIIIRFIRKQIIIQCFFFLCYYLVRCIGFYLMDKLRRQTIRSHQMFHFHFFFFFQKQDKTFKNITQ